MMKMLGKMASCLKDHRPESPIGNSKIAYHAMRSRQKITGRNPSVQQAVAMPYRIPYTLI
jgi:hypothetical protein